ncbi:MAG TPA: GNAT family protein [Streptosporangiaceae bacterium]|nr:GNAT family protein [Streptosporangiaceae bacterium]
MSNKYPVEVSGANVLLRDFQLSDVAECLDIVGDDTVTRWLSFDSRTQQQAKAMLEGAIERAQLVPRTEYYLAVTLPRTGQVIGFVRLGFSGQNAAKLGYAIRADEWGHGYATDAAQALISYGFSKLGLHRISAAIGPDNAVSITVVKKLGFTLEGRIRDHVFTNGAWRDSLLYSLLEHEWNYAAYSVDAVG